MTRLRTAIACLAAGCLATTLAAAASLTVSGTTTKRAVWIAVAISVSLLTGYAIGRTRPGPRLFRWAEHRDRGPHGPGWWVAQVIGLAAVAWMITAHPRRSAANRRSWRDVTPPHRSPAIRVPAPALDPDWAAHRQDTP